MDTQRVENASRTQAVNVLERTFARVDALGRPDILADVRALFERGMELRAARLTVPDQFAADRRAILDRLVAGDIDPMEAAAQVADVVRVSDERGALPALFRDAAEHAIGRAWEMVRTRGDDLVNDLRSIVDVLVRDAIAEAATVPEEVDNDASALGAGAEVAAAWSRLRDLEREWQTAHALLFELRTSGALPADIGGWPVQVNPLDYRFERPDIALDLVRRGVPLVLIVPRAAAAGARPGAYSAADVRARRCAAEERAAA